MNRLSKFVENVEWIVASPASEAANCDNEILVSRKAVKRIPNLLRTYVLINQASGKIITNKRGNDEPYRSVIYRRDISSTTGLSRISSIAFFSEPFAKGKVINSFFYFDEPWNDDQQGFTGPLIQFTQNHAPSL